jgi:beta-1,4-N-acetylglucosaminyltransferase
MAEKKTLLVTVGTTKFDELIEFISDSSFLEFVYQHGFHRMIVQHGKSQFNGSHPKLQIVSFDYSATLVNYYSIADTIISSGGSGTILECLEMDKDFIVVLNTTLQDNHQIELSQKLSEQGYLIYTNVKDLQSVLGSERTRRVWQPVQNPIVPVIISEYLGL